MGAWIEIKRPAFLVNKMRLVAPFVGAWIEISFRLSVTPLVTVAPFVGAWIEIDKKVDRYDYSEVAPFVGAWIEIKFAYALNPYKQRRSLRGSVD